MHTFIRILTLFLLLFNGFGALYGSYHFITDPSGESLQMPRNFLQHSPFSNYLIPLHLTLFGVGGMLIGCGGYLAKLK